MSLKEYGQQEWLFLLLEEGPVAVVVEVVVAVSVFAVTEAIGLDGRDSLKKEYRAQGPSYLTLTLLELASVLDALLSFLPVPIFNEEWRGGLVYNI